MYKQQDGSVYGVVFLEPKRMCRITAGEDWQSR
jgi:hypothetical protein